MTSAPKRFYEFGPFRIDASERLLLRDGSVVPLTPKVFDTLLVLVESSGHILSKGELLRQVWEDTAVEEASLTKNISTLRKALGQTPETDQYVETIPWRGYRFAAGVREVSEDSAVLIVEERSRSRLVIQHEGVEDAEVLPASIGIGQGKVGEGSTTRKKGVIIVAASAALLAAAAVWLLASGRGDRTGPAIRTIAVLPFKSLNSEVEDDYLRLGMADTLIVRLSNIKRLIVRPTAAVRKYSAIDQDPLTAGREQGVDAVLDGSIHKSEGRIRVTARLIKVDDGASLWAGQFDEKNGEIFKLQDSIVERLAGALALELTGEEQRRLKKRYTENTEAYTSYLKGRYHLERRTVKDVEKSIEYFQRAIEIDPHYALAYAGLAESYPSLSVLGAVPSNAVVPKARAAVTQALAIDEQLGEAYTSLGLIKTIYDWDWPGAEQANQRALQLNPNSALAHRIYGHFLRTTGRLDEAMVEFRKAVELEPLSIVANRDLGTTLYVLRQYDQATEQLQKTAELDTNFGTVYGFLRRVYEARHMYDEAVAAELRQMTLLGDRPERIAALRQAYASAGWKGFLRRQLDFLNGESGQDGYQDPYQMVLIYARLGDNEQAFFWLEKCYEQRNFWLNFIKVDPLLDVLRQDQRYADLLRRVGLAEQG